MSEDFEQRLRARFATSEELPVSEPFGAAVRQRIAGLRRVRRIVLATAIAAAGLAVAILGAPLLATGTTLIAEAPTALNGALSALLVSPAGFVLGALTGAVALAAAFTD
jgi:hypothetical protein